MMHGTKEHMKMMDEMEGTSKPKAKASQKAMALKNLAKGRAARKAKGGGKVRG